MKKICTNCNIEKDIIEFPKRKDSKDGYRNNCKACRKEENNKYYMDNIEEAKNNSILYKQINKDKLKQQSMEYAKNNKEKRNQYSKWYNKEHKDKLNAHIKNKKITNPTYRLITNLRSLVCISFKRAGYKKSNKTSNILGCSYDEFREYIKSQFEPWMNENNQGKYTGNYNETWQIDHIKPISISSTPEEVIELNHYTNLRPLCSRKNLEKSNTYIK